METNEMKEKNERTLRAWRQSGLLGGLKEGSTNEWRCAKSYDDFARCILVDPDLANSLDTIAIYGFPLIRRALCTGKKRLHRIIKPEEVITFLKTATLKDCAEMKEDGTLNYADILMSKILRYSDICNETLLEFFLHIDNDEKEPYKILKTLFFLPEDTLGLLPTLVFFGARLFVERNTKKKE